MAKLFGKDRSKKPFNANEHGDMKVYEPIPADKYVARITESSYEPTKKKDGHYLKLKFVIQEGKFKGRTVFENLNLDNPNEETVRISETILATICRAAGRNSIEDSEELHGVDMVITVGIKKGNATNPPSNKINFFERVKGAPKKPSMKDEDDDEDGAESRSTSTRKKPQVDFGDDDEEGDED